MLKRTDDFQLVEKIRRVAQGESAFDDRPPQTEVADPVLDRLTDREISILELIAEETNREIADELLLAEKTVKDYVSNLLSKMGLRHRPAAAASRRAIWRPSASSTAPISSGIARPETGFRFQRVGSELLRPPTPAAARECGGPRHRASG